MPATLTSDLIRYCVAHTRGGRASEQFIQAVASAALDLPIYEVRCRDDVSANRTHAVFLVAHGDAAMFAALVPAAKPRLAPRPALAAFEVVAIRAAARTPAKSIGNPDGMIRAAGELT